MRDQSSPMDLDGTNSPLWNISENGSTESREIGWRNFRGYSPHPTTYPNPLCLVRKPATHKPKRASRNTQAVPFQIKKPATPPPAQFSLNPPPLPSLSLPSGRGRAQGSWGPKPGWLSHVASRSITARYRYGCGGGTMDGRMRTRRGVRESQSERCGMGGAPGGVWWGAAGAPGGRPHDRPTGRMWCTDFGKRTLPPIPPHLTTSVGWDPQTSYHIPLTTFRGGQLSGGGKTKRAGIPRCGWGRVRARFSG